MAHDALAKSQRVFLLLTVITLILAGGLSYMQITEWRTIKSEADKIAKELDNPDALRRQVSEVRNAMVSSRLAVAHLELNLPTRDYVPTMLRELEAMGHASGLRITGVRPVPKKEKPKAVDGEKDKAAPGAPKDDSKKKEERKPYEEMDFDIQATGQYMQILKFLEMVSGFPKIIAVRSVSINATPNPRDVGPPKLTATFGVRAYIFPTRPQNLAESPSRASTERSSSTQGVSGGG
ncbi:MAG: type 4a pilus biogenesis protein PilO [Fimbriimonadia bacterium]